MDDDLIPEPDPKNPCTYLEYTPKAEARRAYCLDLACKTVMTNSYHNLVMAAIAYEAYLAGKYLTRFKLPSAKIFEIINEISEEQNSVESDK